MREKGSFKHRHMGGRIHVDNFDWCGIIPCLMGSLKRCLKERQMVICIGNLEDQTLGHILVLTYEVANPLLTS